VNNDDLDNVLRTLNLSQCVDALATLNEKERKALSERALQWLIVSGHNISDSQWNFRLQSALTMDHLSLLGASAIHPRWEKIANTIGTTMSFPSNVQRLITPFEKLALTLPPEAVQPLAIEPARAAVFGTCTFGEIKKHAGQPTNADACCDILTARKPRWASQWACYVLDREPRIFWPVIRRLEKEEVIATEVNSDYLLGMCIGMGLGGKIADVSDKIADQLRQDETLRERVWSMLEEDSAIRILTSEWFGQKWLVALADLAKDGTISRLQLLERTLATLTRLALESSERASKLDLGWFSDLHSKVSPTPEEDAQLAEGYIRILYSRNTATVGWIIAHLKQMLLSHVEVPLDSLCAGLEAVFLVKGKENAVKAIDCLTSLAETIPSARCAAGLAALGALENDSQDIQKRAISLIEKYGAGQADVKEKLRDNLDRVAIVHRQRAQDWLQKQSKTGAATEIKGDQTKREQSDPTDTHCESSAFDLAQMREACRSVAERWQDCAGIKAAIEAIDAGAPDLPCLEFDGTEYPRLNPDLLFQAVDSFDDLVFLLAKLVRDHQIAVTASDELERALEAIGRMGAAPPADYHQRLQTLKSDGGSIVQLFGPVGGSIQLWLLGDKTDQWRKSHPIDEILTKRFDCAGKQAKARVPTVMLSTPTHQGGWIDPLVLVDRVLEQGQNRQNLPSTSPDVVARPTQLIAGSTNLLSSAVGLTPPISPTQLTSSSNSDTVLDQCLALSRLAPDHRKEALAKLLATASGQAEFTEALRYALGDTSVQIGSSAPLWIAAARARAPFADDDAVERNFPGLGPDAGRAAQYNLSPCHSLMIRKASPMFHWTEWAKLDLIERLPRPVGAQIDDIVSTAMHKTGQYNRSLSCPFIYRHWASTICPLMLESWFAHGAESIARSLNMSSSDSNIIFIAKLYDPDIPLKQMALLTMAVALSSKHKDDSGPALEALIQTIDDGRLNSDKLASVMKILRGMDKSLANAEYELSLVSLTRWCKATKTAALTSPYHALVISGAIEQMLSGDPSAAPKDLHAILEVLLELLVQQKQSIARPEAREYLSGIKTSGKTAKLVKQLLALKNGQDADGIRANALMYALEKRIDRAHRWQSWSEHSQTTAKPAALTVN